VRSIIQTRRINRLAQRAVSIRVDAVISGFDRERRAARPRATFIEGKDDGDRGNDNGQDNG
jgi:hypothetical protein